MSGETYSEQPQDAQMEGKEYTTEYTVDQIEEMVKQNPVLPPDVEAARARWMDRLDLRRRDAQERWRNFQNGLNAPDYHPDEEQRKKDEKRLEELNENWQELERSCQDANKRMYPGAPME